MSLTLWLWVWCDLFDSRDSFISLKRILDSRKTLYCRLAFWMNFNLLYVLIYIIFSLIESKNQSLKSHDYQNGHESWDNNDIFWQTDMAMICKWVGSGSSRDNGHIFYSYMEKVHSPDETTRSGFNIKFSSVCSLFAGRVVGSMCQRVETSRLESLWIDLFA